MEPPDVHKQAGDDVERIGSAELAVEGQNGILCNQDLPPKTNAASNVTNEKNNETSAGQHPTAACANPDSERRPPSDSEVAAKLNQYLSEDDLSLNVTERQLRSRLEEHFGAPLKDRKAVIRAQVVQWLARKQTAKGQGAVADDDDNDSKPAPKRSRKAKKQPLLSEQLQNFLGVDRMDRFQVTKRIWDYIKEHNLQKPDDKRYILPDEKLATIFTAAPLHMFHMAKHLSKHIYADDTVIQGEEMEPRKRGTDSDGDEEPSAKRQKPAAKRAKKATGGGSGKKSAFQKPLQLTPEMQEWYGPEQATRGGLTKRFYEYIDEHELKDPNDKRFVNCDETLKKLTGQSRLKAFGAIKYLNAHVLGNAEEKDTEAEGDQEADGDELSD